MTYKKLVNGEYIQMTDEEISLRQAEENEFIVNMPMKKWLQEIQESDALLSRVEEDLIDRSGTEGLPEKLIEKYNYKKLLREQKPDGNQ